jgi:hypothetical protein
MTYSITPTNNTFSNTCPLLVHYEASNKIVAATCQNIVGGVYVARPPVTNFAAMNLFLANTAHPLQNCRLYYSQIQMEPQHAITYNNSNTNKKVIYRTFVTNNYPAVSAGGSFNQLINSGIVHPTGVLIVPFFEGRSKWLSMKKPAPHGAPRRDIRSPWRQLLSLPIPCHVHWPRSCCQSACVRLPYVENLVSGTVLPYMRWCAFLGRAYTRGAIMRRASTAGAGATTWVRGVCAWRRWWVTSVGGVLLAAGRACGNGVRVDMSGAGRRGAFRRCRFECAWTLGLVRGPVALSGLLLRPPSRALGFYCVERGWVPKMFLTMRTLRMARS